MRLWTCLICNQPAGETPLYVARHMYCQHGIPRGVLNTTRQSDLQTHNFPPPIDKQMVIIRYELEGRGDILEVSTISENDSPDND
jgi:hypothetical protein